MAGIEPILDLDSIMQQCQMERTAGGTQTMTMDAEGRVEPPCDYISPQFAKAAANDPSYELAQERTFNPDALNI